MKASIEDNQNGNMKKETKIALITGSSRGIGRAIALELAKNSFKICINNDRRPYECLDVVREIESYGQDALYIQADVSDPEQVEKMVISIIDKFGKINVLVNNAGIVMDKKLENMTIDQWNRVLSVNLTGTFNCTKSVIKYMKEQGGGKIINISSVVGEMGNFGQSNYAASKGGVIAFTKTIAREYARYGILVNAIAPGFIKTRMVEEGIPEDVLKKILAQIPLGRLGETVEVAKLVCFLASEDSDYITGQVININGGFYM